MGATEERWIAVCCSECAFAHSDPHTHRDPKPRPGANACTGSNACANRDSHSHSNPCSCRRSGRRNHAKPGTRADPHAGAGAAGAGAVRASGRRNPAPGQRRQPYGRRAGAGPGRRCSRGRPRPGAHSRGAAERCWRRGVVLQPASCSTAGGAASASHLDACPSSGELRRC